VQGEVVPQGGVGGDVVHLIARSGPVSQVILGVLLLFSVISWAIVLYKIWAFRRAERHTASFLDVFRKSSKFSEVQAACRSVSESPLVGIFQAGYAELNAQLRQANSSDTQSQQTLTPGALSGRPRLKSLQSVDRALLRAAAVEMTKLERRIGFLATTASITPFIGLFGTVWGIMGAFERIGQMASTNLAVVAPGISEALIATAAGLFAAIPAVYFYNFFTQRVKQFGTEMDDFALEFLNISERNFT
jgi:biopolymer transport protein TolQ